MADEDSWSAVVADLGDFDGLVNCAGIRTVDPIISMPRLAMERILAVNLLGPMLGTREATVAWSAAGHGGAIVNVASLNGLRAPVPGQAHYAASKGGLIAYTRAAAVELGPLSIRVNAVAPGAIRTPMTEARFSDESFNDFVQRHVPLGRGGEATELAAAVVFLLSSRASYITGAVLTVDGGHGAT